MNYSTNDKAEQIMGNSMNEQIDEILQKVYKHGVDVGHAREHVSTVETLQEAKAKIQRIIVEAKHGIVTTALNLLNTEPIHTVEQALLFDEDRLGKELENDQL